MAKMTIDKGHFNDRVSAMQDIQHTGYWPHTFVSGASPELPIHRHDHDVIGYVVEGETYFEKGVEIQAETTALGGHHEFETFGFFERGDDGIMKLALALGLRGVLGEQGHKRLSAFNQ